MPFKLPTLLVLAFVLLLSGCGGVRYVYSQLDWIVPWYARDYVRLDGEQRALLNARLSDRLAWHCASELPAYSAFLRDLDGDLKQRHLEVGILQPYLGRAEGFWDALVVTVAPDIADVLAELGDEQIAELAKNLDVRNVKTREEFLDPSEAERHENRVERMEKRLRRWYGRLSAEQVERIETWSQALAPATEDWFENRLGWQSQLLDALAVRQDRNQFNDRVLELIMNPDAGWSDSYRAQVNANRDLTIELIVDVHNAATVAQRARVASELDSLAGQFDRLACSAPTELRQLGWLSSVR